MAGESDSITSGISSVVVTEGPKKFWDFDYFGRVSFLFAVKVGKKLVETALSVKVWILFLTFFYARDLLMAKYITGDNFASIVSSVMGVVVAMRGISKISIMVADRFAKQPCTCQQQTKQTPAATDPPEGANEPTEEQENSKEDLANG